MHLSSSSLALFVGLTLGAVAPRAQADVMVHLFQWKYADIAKECEQVLGPKGYGAVQISPPNEHKPGPQWWVVYQPVSYLHLDSQAGKEAELRSMIQHCHQAGVKVYADAVFNQMASGSGVGTAGSAYSERHYPDMGPESFHSGCIINNYQNRQEVQNCDLLGMPDIHTGKPAVQDKLATYLKRLLSLGIDGFRIDAAKHIASDELATILAKAGHPYVFQEVIGADAEPIQPKEYINNGLVTEFKYGTTLASNFKRRVSDLEGLDESWGLLPSAKAEVFVINHDRERDQSGGAMLSFRDGERYQLANVFMLAWPYGALKQVMSGYNFHSDTDQGAPNEPACSPNSAWNCEHRWPAIANMVAFANEMQKAPEVLNWWSNNDNQIAFSRGHQGFVAINNSSQPMDQPLQTGLPAGEYCNILAADSPCSGANIQVAADGKARIQLPAMRALALRLGAKPAH